MTGHPTFDSRHDPEGNPTQFPAGWLGTACFAACALLAAYALTWTQVSINTAIYRASFLGAVLSLLFLLMPAIAARPKRTGPLIEHAVAALAALGLLGFAAIEAKLGERRTMATSLMAAAALGFVLMPLGAAWPRFGRLRLSDALFAALAIAVAVYLALEIESYKTRPTRPTAEELALGAILIVLVLEAARRAVGWILPFIALVFLAYAWFGPQMPEPFDHRGFSLNRIVGQNALTLEGIFSTPMDVAATFIVLFTIYGAVLERGGAGGFFIDWTFALFGRKPSPAAPGRAIVASGFLLGTVSGSGVATTVTLASIGAPMLKRSGYPAHVAGGMLAAAGIGATLSPPTLGAAAFIIAEYLKVDYLQVLIYAAIPTLLYYFGCLLMTEADARRYDVKAVRTSEASLLSLTLSHGYHFLSLAAIAVALALGFTSFMAVFWSIAVAFALSMIRADSRLVTPIAFWAGLAAGVAVAIVGRTDLPAALGIERFVDARASVAVFWGVAVATLVSLAQSFAVPAGSAQRKERLRMTDALSSGARSVLGVAATCACAGIIVSVVNLTGLGLTISGMIVELGGGVRLAVILLAAVAMWVLGAAVPVTASYIIAAVMLVPALVAVGVPEPAAHMFMFYYAVLADVSPPTALAPFAAAAIVRAEPFSTMLQAWKYTLPAFLVPIMFCLTPHGTALLALDASGLTAATAADWGGVALQTGIAALALAGFVIALTGHAAGPAPPATRLLAAAGGLALLWNADPAFASAGAALVLLALVLQARLARRQTLATRQRPD